MPNRLAKEKSPYLLQHKDNPVDWHPWGEEAFELAKTQKKPVFLSIGYATCHWCHVMEHESFEDEQIAKALNEAFINIKVDREERPDIDSQYMTVCQMLNGQGGWPLTLILTPEKEPFFAGTYIPKETRYNRLGLRQLIKGISGVWNNEPEKIDKAVAKIKEGYGRSQQFERGNFPGTEAIDYAAAQLMASYDAAHGGLGDAPKFPSPHNLMFLIRQWKQTGETRFLETVKHTLTEMRKGGLWDHIGFGFHRYSTDAQWLLPHFEKMLYDQALLIMVYTEAWQITQNPLFKQTVEEIGDYVFRDLQGDESGFFSAEDADSEGEEGKFYVWPVDEIRNILSADESDWFISTFNLKEEGNFKEEATKELTGTNIPHLTELNSSEKWEAIREKLFSVREQRERPLLDDKTLTDWNALMIAALAKAGAVFENKTFILKAEEAYHFIQEKLVRDGRLYHRYKNNDTAIEAFADDYTFLIWASIELYEATFKPKYLKKALELNEQLISRFWDNEKSGFFLSVKDNDQPLGRQKQIFDGAIPSSNSVAFQNLIRLGRFTGDTNLEEKANQLGELFSNELIRSGSSITVSMMALQFLHHDPKEIVIAEGDNDATEIIKELHSRFIPNKVLLFRPKEGLEELTEIAGFVEAQTPIENQTSVYICRNYACEKPVTELPKLQSALL